MAKRVSLKDIAEVVGVSQNTVSLALRGRPGCNEDTREKILNVAKELGYFQSTANSSSIILIISTVEANNDTYFFSQIQQTIKDDLAQKAYRVVNSLYMGESKEENEKINDIISQLSPKGIIILGQIPYAACQLICKFNIPVVCCGFYYLDDMLPSVLENNIAGMHALMTHLYECGYRKMSFFGFTSDAYDITFWERRMVYAGFVEEHHLEDQKIPSLRALPSDDLLNPERLAEHIEGFPLPEVFVCSNDLYALSLIKALYLRGYNVPDDVAVVGYDNSTMASMSIPTLTTVNTDKRRIAISTIQTLLEQISDRTIQPRHVLIPSQLVVGSSTKKME